MHAREEIASASVKMISLSRDESKLQSDLKQNFHFTLKIKDGGGAIWQDRDESLAQRCGCYWQCGRDDRIISLLLAASKLEVTENVDYPYPTDQKLSSMTALCRRIPIHIPKSLANVEKNSLTLLNIFTYDFFHDLESVG